MRSSPLNLLRFRGTGRTTESSAAAPSQWYRSANSDASAKMAAQGGARKASRLLAGPDVLPGALSHRFKLHWKDNLGHAVAFK